MSMLAYLGKKFWSPSFWLPPNVTWEEIETSEGNDGYRVSKIRDVFFAFQLIPCVLIIRCIIENGLAVKVAKCAGVKSEPREKPPHVDALERTFCLNPKRKKWRKEMLIPLTKQLDWSVEEIEDWLGARRRYEAPANINKFGESSWRFIFFAFMFTYGLYAHWSEQWFWDLRLCWETFPQPVTEDLYWYFIISLANYSAWTLSLFWDVPRKDPKIMAFHHFLALVILIGQWVNGFNRFCVITCFCHDICDSLLELSKCLKYAGFKRTCQGSFILFTVIWITTRNIILPFYIMPSFYHSSPLNFPGSFPFSCLSGVCNFSTFTFTSSHVFLLALVSLSLLHVYWSCLIFRVLYLYFFTGKFEDDTVSDSEDET